MPRTTTSHATTTTPLRISGEMTIYTLLNCASLPTLKNALNETNAAERITEWSAYTIRTSIKLNSAMVIPRKSPSVNTETTVLSLILLKISK